MASFFYRTPSHASLSRPNHNDTHYTPTGVEKNRVNRNDSGNGNDNCNVIRGKSAKKLRKSILTAVQSNMNHKHADADEYADESSSSSRSRSSSDSDSSESSCSSDDGETRKRTHSQSHSNMKALSALSKKKSFRHKTVLNKFQSTMRQSAFGRFISCEDLTSDDLDDSVNQMALVCAVILTIPYQVGQTVGPSYFDWLRSELDKCPKASAGGYDFGIALAAFREYMLCCMFSTMCGMILSTFYFLFKRTVSDPSDHRTYMRKCRYITIYIFICTSFGIISLIMLSNFLIEWFVVPTDALCTETEEAVMLVGFGMLVAFLVFLLSIYLVF